MASTTGPAVARGRAPTTAWAARTPTARHRACAACATASPTLGGTLAVDSPPGAGTRLEARIPLAPWRSAREPFLEVGHADDGGAARTIADIEAGRKRVSVSLAREWELEGGLPRIGRRLPVIDHHGVRRATVEIERVALVPFADVGPDVVPHEATRPSRHEAWRERQTAFYDRCREERRRCC